MGSIRNGAAGLAVFALSSLGPFVAPALAQGGSQDRVPAASAAESQSPMTISGPPREDQFQFRAGPGNRPNDARSQRRGKGVRDLKEPAPAAGTPPAAAAPSNGGAAPAPPSAVPAPSPAPPATAPAPGPPAVADEPSGLSDDAPDIPPSLGVGGGGDTPSGPSPSATPEPTTLLLMGTGLLGMYRLRNRR